MPASLSTRIAAAKRLVHRIEEDRPLLLKRIADHREEERELAINAFEDSLRSAKQKRDILRLIALSDLMNQIVRRVLAAAQGTRFF